MWFFCVACLLIGWLGSEWSMRRCFVALMCLGLLFAVYAVWCGYVVLLIACGWLRCLVYWLRLFDLVLLLCLAWCFCLIWLLVGIV